MGGEKGSKMQKKSTEAKAAVALIAAALAGTGALMLSSIGRAHPPAHHAAPARSVAADGWQTDKDAARGFLVTHPVGWTVQADDHSILIQSQHYRLDAAHHQKHGNRGNDYLVRQSHYPFL